MAQSSGVEHRVRIPAHGGTGAGKGVAAPPERLLNCFVRSLALIERLGNALGTLAFTWATVVLLGGYPSTLRQCDFQFFTTIFFIEAARMFSRNNRTDYQLFFGTRGAFRPLDWNMVILVVYFNGVVFIMKYHTGPALLPTLGIVLAIGQFICPGVPRILARIPLRRAISLWSPMAGIILLGASLAVVEKKRPAASRCIVYAGLLVVVLLVTVSRIRFPSIIRLADRALGEKQEFWRQLVLRFCMIGAIVMASVALSRDNWRIVPVMILNEASILVFVSFGNFQIPASIVRVVLPVKRLINGISDDYKYNCLTCQHDDAVNLARSLYIFYVMVLGQGALYLAACVVEIFSFIPRRTLVRRGGFKGEWGVDSVNLYYAYALEKCLEGNVLAPKISLCSFAIDSLNSGSTKRQIHGIRTAHILLQREPTRTRLLPKLNASTNTMTRLMTMLHWTGQENDTVRLFAAKVIDEIAKSLLVVTSPGIIQNVSLLLGCGNGNQRKGRNPLLDADGEQEQQNDLLVNAYAVPDTVNPLETQDHSTQPTGNDERNYWIVRWWRQILECWTVAQEGKLTAHDLLPVLGMSAIESLAAYDQSNCEEISKATGLIRKIARFTRFSRSDTTYTEAEKKVLVHSSLKLFHRLTSIDGEIGIALRHKISKHPFLLRNLSEILGDTTSCYEPRMLAARILRNLAVDSSTRQTIGRLKSIITRLMQAFLTPDGPSSTDGDRLLRKAAGQALAMLATGNADNCLAMLRGTGYTFIKELTAIIIHSDGRRGCVAASLLRSMCMHARPELNDTDLLQLSSISFSRKVLETTLRAEGAELEIFIGLISHVYEAIPEEFARDFEYGEIKEAFARRLVHALNANMEPNADCPGIRRVILEQAIKLMEYDDYRNVNCFRNLRMMEVLLTVEVTISEAENYTIFMDDVELLEAGEPLSSLVSRAKELLDVRTA